MRNHAFVLVVPCAYSGGWLLVAGGLVLFFAMLAVGCVLLTESEWHRADEAIRTIRDQLLVGIPLGRIPPPQIGKLHVIGYEQDGETGCFYISSDRRVTRWKIGMGPDQEERTGPNTRETVFSRTMTALLPGAGCRKLLIYVRQDFGFVASGIHVDIDPNGLATQVGTPLIMD
ncbi:MAG: hypothetical protein HQL77_11545 [Magnetococcales bacterium]|nr:hypothetical protein [Magnetococcales bacterium]